MCFFKSHANLMDTPILLTSLSIVKLLPDSIVSGLSVVFLRVITGILKIAHSSCTVPLSVKTHLASFSKLTNWKNQWFNKSYF